jgi:hypothetical protein
MRDIAAATIARAYEIATYNPVTDWATLIAESEPDIREAVRECLADMYRRRQRDEALRARVDSGVDVVIEIQKNGKAHVLPSLPRPTKRSATPPTAQEHQA